MLLSELCTIKHPQRQKQRIQTLKQTDKNTLRNIFLIKVCLKQKLSHTLIHSGSSKSFEIYNAKTYLQTLIIYYER